MGIWVLTRCCHRRDRERPLVPPLCRMQAAAPGRWFVAAAILVVATASGCRPSGSTVDGPSDLDAFEELDFEQQILGVRQGWLDVIAVEGCTTYDHDLAALADLTDLLELKLDDTRITDDGLQYLSGLENLEHLRLRDAAITDAGLQHLLPLKYLRILNLPQARFTDAGLASLKQLPELEQLRFSSPHVTDAGMAELANFPVLWHLHLIQVPITDRGLLPLERMAGLMSLYMDGMQITDDGLRRLIERRQRLALEPLHLHIDQHHRDFDPMKGTHEH